MAEHALPTAVSASENHRIDGMGTMGEGVWKSYDYGDTWLRLQNYPATVQGITVDLRNDNTVFFAATTGVLRSNDGGATFTTVLPRAAWQITIQSGGSPIVYATTKAFGVYKSVDGGATFTAINNGLTSLIMGRNAPVLIDPEHPNVLYVGPEATGGASGAFKSVNGGASWGAINDGLDDHAVFGMALDTDRPGLLYIRPVGCLSDDHGRGISRWNAAQRSVSGLVPGGTQVGAPSSH